MNRCVNCLSEFPVERNGYRVKSNLCDPCSPIKTPGFPAVSEVIMLCGEERATRAMINEIERRRILPNVDSKSPDSYFVGRYGDNGKIEEKTPEI